MSSITILFLGADPFTKLRLTPRTRANFLTEGDAWLVFPLATRALSEIGSGFSIGLMVAGGSGTGLVGSRVTLLTLLSISFFTLSSFLEVSVET